MKILIRAFFLLLIIPNFARANPLWESYKNTFIKNGRVIDYYQGGISHSEGQGYAMLLAVMNNDKETFVKLWNWTRNNLQVRKDALFAWCWGKRENGKWAVIDYNDATDGDLLIAYALIRAAKRWQEASYLEEAKKIIKSLREELAVNMNGRLFLLPAYYGFYHAGKFLLNSSYIITKIYRTFAELDDRNFWLHLVNDGRHILEIASNNPSGLPPNWIYFDDKGIHPAKDKVFGYEAVRVLLYMCWENDPWFPKGINKIFSFYKALGYLPLWVNTDGQSISLQDAPAGFYAIYSCVADRLGMKKLANKLKKEALKRLQKEKNNYYSFSLFLLVYSGGISW